MKRYVRFSEIQYGIKIPLADHAHPVKTERLSDHLRPFLFVHGHDLKTKMVDDPDLTAVVYSSGLDASSFAMAFPNMEAIYQDLFKYSYTSVPPISRELEDFAVDVIIQMLQSALPEQQFKPDTFHEAASYVNRDTSCGYPENMKYANKGAWLDDDAIDHESIAKRYANTGVCIGQCSFKEEVRPLEKLEQEKARSFVSGNIVENICWLVYAGPFFRALASNWRDSPITYGISELHRGWHFLLERIGKWLGFKTDMKQCDGSLDLYLQKLVARVWKFFIADESPGPGWPKAHEAIDRMTESNCKMWMRLPTGVIFLKKQGNGSGGGATIQFNSCGQLAIVIMWLRNQGMSKNDILRHFEFQCHGDDGRFAASPEYLTNLDFQSMNAWWKSLGRLYQFEVEGEGPSDLSTLPWLSRNTTVFQGTYVPYPKEPAKLLASAVLRNRLPEKVHPKAYVRARWWQLTNQLVFVPTNYSPINHETMVRLGEQYEKVCVTKDPTLINNIEWRNAGKNRKNKRWLELQHISTETKPVLNEQKWELQGKIASRKRVPLHKTLLLALALCACVLVPEYASGESDSLTLHGARLNIVKPCEKSFEMTKGLSKPKKKLVKKVVAAANFINKKKKKVVKKQANLIRGKGDFFSDVWKKGKTLLGQGLHKGIDFLSGRAKDAVGHLFGHGDYHLSPETIKSNSLYSGASMVPTFQNTAQHGTIVTRRESLGIFESNTSFDLRSIVFNPGMSEFSWVSRIAGAWQRYKVHGAIVEWVPRVPEISTNAGGSVVLSARYDLTTAAPRSIVEAEVGFGAITGRPMDKMIMPIECKNSMNPTNVLNVRFGANLPTGANAQFFDHCIIDVSINGQASAGTVIGEVFITYDIEFMMPTAEHVQNSGIQTYSAYAATSTALPYGSVWTPRTNSTLTASVAISGQVAFDFDDSQPLPVGSTWLILYTNMCTGGNITTNASMSFGADFQGDTLVFKNASGTDVSTLASGTPSTQEFVCGTFQVVSATGAQQVILSGLVMAASVTGYATITLVPVLSTLSLEEMMMRHRYPALFETEDMLKELRGLKASLPKLIIDTDQKYVDEYFHARNTEKGQPYHERVREQDDEDSSHQFWKEPNSRALPRPGREEDVVSIASTSTASAVRRQVKS